MNRYLQHFVAGNKRNEYKTEAERRESLSCQVWKLGHGHKRLPVSGDI